MMRLCDSSIVQANSGPSGGYTFSLDEARDDPADNTQDRRDSDDGDYEEQGTVEQQYYLSHLEIVKDVAKEICQNLIQTRTFCVGWGAKLSCFK